MKRYYILSTALLVILSFTSCKKQVDEQYQPLVFHSLAATHSTFSPGESTSIFAEVTGTQVNYYWSYNSGSIDGGGDNITYTCLEPGYHKVICTVVDGEGEVDAKEITFNVQ